MKTLIQQLNQSSSRIHAALAGEYVRRFSHVPDDQLQRFERVMSRLMKKYPAAVYGELWLNAEGESQKAPRLVHLSDLAEHIDRSRKEARELYEHINS
ncbi:pyocin activator PrtN family protein [Citrobacter sp. Cm038]|uniref:pyocin activator PrtN family protein n=1 Tax=Citrobacter sp. Cm038 TaxID=2985117 RepID=UPI002574BA50|nr:pyocin activator PrtN family protein [Citrobacter sp. Cm038]MDM2944788.1 pyocin activator PrtN family protein [Citrobacter sp. Cm038]